MRSASAIFKLNYPSVSKLITRGRKISKIWDRCYDFKNIFGEKFS
jgi:hypothetical protein